MDQNEVMFSPPTPHSLLDKDFTSCTQSHSVEDFHFPLSLL